MRIVMDLPMTNLWIVLSGVSLLAHITLNKAPRHAYTELAYTIPMSVIRMDWFRWAN